MAPRGGRPSRRLAWRADPQPVVRPEMRDQFGLRIGWVRFWLRGVLLGFGLWLTAASLALWAPLQGAVPPFFYGGLVLMPGCGLLALLAWITPFPREIGAVCGRCGHSDRVLVLPFAVPHTCRHCRRRGVVERGRMEIGEYPGH